MNKLTVYLILALALSSLVLLPISLGERTISVTLSSSGTIVPLQASGNFSTSFETGALNEFTSTTGAPTVVNSNPNSGSHSMSVNPSSAWTKSYSTKAVSAASDLDVRFYFRCDNLPSNGNYAYIAELDNIAGTCIWFVYITNDAGTYSIVLQSPVSSTAWTYTPPNFYASTYYCIEVDFTKSSTVGQYQLYWNGNYVAGLSNLNTSNAGTLGIINIGAGPTQGASYASPNLRFDDIAISDHYIGPMVPISKPSTHTLQNAIVIYGATNLNSTETAFVASNFNVLICDFTMGQPTLQNLKRLNPNLQVFGYLDAVNTAPRMSFWSTINANEGWFMHNNAGNRIMFTSFQNYIMDPSSQEWRQFYTSYINTKLNGTDFDGVFMDDVWDKISNYLNWGSIQDAVTKETLTTANFSNETLSGWHSNMVGYLRYVEDNILAGMKEIVNTDEYVTNDYISVVDGKMDEGWVGHPNWYDLNTFEDPTYMLAHINAMARDSATGKIIIAENGAITPEGVLDATIQAKLDKNIVYSYVATLFAMNGSNALFGYAPSPNMQYTYATGIHGAVNASVGLPIGSYYKTQNIYVRDFTTGKALLNPSANTYTFSLETNYQLRNGTIVQSLVLGPWSAEILLTT